MTQEQINELFMCQDDPIYCIKTYFKIKHPTQGLVNFELYDYQEEVIRRALKNRFNIVLFPRQSGKCMEAGSSLIVVDIATFGFVKKKLHILLIKLLDI